MIRPTSLLLVGAASAAPVLAQWSADRLAEPRAMAAGVAVGDLALFAGGHQTLGPGSLLLFDLVDIVHRPSGTWTTAALSQPRTNLAAAAVGDLALFAGGATDGGASAVVDLFDASGGTWSTALLTQARWGAAGASVGDRVLVAGGTLGAVDSDVVDVFDAANGSWSTARLSRPRAFLCAATVGDRVFFAGGRDPSDVVDVYDAASDTWSTLQLSAPRAQVAAAAVGERVLFAGGRGPAATASDVVDVYDSATGTWSTAQLSEPRFGMAAAAVGGRVLFAGGWTIAPQVSATVDIFDETSGAWSTASMTRARAALSVAAVGHEALIAGGFTGCTLEKCKATALVDRYEAWAGGSYCGPAVPNSSGASALLVAAGSGVAGDELLLMARDLPTQRQGYFLVAPDAGALQPPGSQGLLCLGGTIGRFVGPGQVLDSGAAGRFELAVDTGALPLGPPVAVQPGETWRFQAWFRDANPQPTSNFTDGWELTFR